MNLLSAQYNMFIKIKELVFMRTKSIEGYVSASENLQKSLIYKGFLIISNGQNRFVEN